MQETGVFDSLIYLDKEYISAKYEEVTGYAPDISITKAEGLNAGIRIPILSAGASSIESKSYKLSTSAMLSAIMGELSKLNEFSSSDHALGQRSKIAWVTGNFFVSQVKVTRSKHTVTIIGKPKETNGTTKEQVAEENYFKISANDETSFALITAPNYFFIRHRFFQKFARECRTFCRYTSSGTSKNLSIKKRFRRVDCHSTHNHRR